MFELLKRWYVTFGPTDTLTMTGRAGVRAALGTMMLLIIVSRLLTFDRPPDWDLRLYQAVGHGLRSGHELYAEQWDNKPPGVYLAYGASEVLVGLGSAQFLLLGTLLAGGTLLAVFSAGSAGGTLAGIGAAGTWTLIQADPFTGAHQPNAESFMMLFVALGFAAVVRGRHTGWWAGITWAAATFFKPNAIGYPALVGLAHVIWSSDRKAAVGDVVKWIVVGLAVWGGVFAYFAVAGRLDDFAAAAVDYNRFYTIGLGTQVLASILPRWLAPADLVTILPLVPLTLAGMFLVEARRRAYWLGLLTASWVAVWLPGRFHDHYYQVYLLVFAVGSGWALGALSRRVRREYTVAVAAALTAAVGVIQLPTYAYNERTWLERVSPMGAEFGTHYRITRSEMARRIRPGEIVFQVGHQPGYQVSTGARPPAGVHFFHHYAAGPVADRLWSMLSDSLRSNPPALVVIDSVIADDFPDHPVHDWVRRNYMPDPEFGSFRRASLHVPRDSLP